MSSFESLIVMYLNQRGYKSAEKVLKQELRDHNVSIDEYAAGHALEAQSSLQNLIKLYNLEETSPEYYTEGYKTLKGFIESSLDLYKDELLNVLFPLFFHCFLDLIAKGFPQDAAEFMHNYKSDHVKRFGNEIRSVMSLFYPDDLETNETAKRLRGNKIDVPLSAYSHQLLLSFLQDNKMYLLLKLLNEYVNLRIVSSKPLAQGAALVAHEDEEDQPNVLWGQLKEIADVEVMSQHPALQVEKRVDESRIPLPELSKVDRETLIEDLKKCVPLTPETLPSTCFYTFLNCNQRLNSCCVSDSGRSVAAAFTNSKIMCWDLDMPKDPAIELIGHSSPVFGMDFSMDQEYLLSASSDHTVRLWSVKDAQNLVVYKGHNYPVWDVKFSPLGYYFASGSNDRTARLWSTERIYPLRIFAGHLSDVDVVDFHPNCNYLVTGSTDKTVRLWDVQSGECVRLLTGHNARVSALAVSSDGRMVASGGEDCVVCLWDISTGKLLEKLEGHEDFVRDLSFSREGSILASGSLDQSIKIWDTKAVRTQSQKMSMKKPEFLLKTYKTKSTPVQSVHFSYRNLLLASGGFVQ